MSSLNSRKLIAEAVKNWPAKVISVALALILVIFHQMSTLEERFFSAPLRVEGANTLLPSGPYARTIRISLRGDPASINPILEDDIEAFVDLSRYAEPGEHRVPVQVRKKGLAQDVEPLEISVEPLEIPMTLVQKTGNTEGP
jgi:YbbR domain-containing protein